jgi:hypothetical protein
MRAWAIDVDGFDSMVAAALTRSKAVFLAFQGAKEAGYSSVTFARIRARRCERLDGWAAKQEKPKLTSMRQADWDADGRT